MWKGGELGEELYDYELDPRELRNLAAEEKHKALKLKLKSQLEDILRARTT
jgi:hypothetical protein